MSFLGNFRVLTKLLAIILVLSAATAGVALLAASSLKSLSNATDTMEIAATQALDAAHLGQIVTAINRAEYSLGVDPRPENRTAVRNAIEEQGKRLNARLDNLAKADDEKAKQNLAAVRQLWQAYAPELEDTFKTADSIKDVSITQERERLRQSILSSKALAEKLQTAAAHAAEDLNARVHADSVRATDEYKQTSFILICVAIVAVMLGLAVGVIIGQWGIAKPLEQMVEPLESIANGDFTATIPGAERQDEVGRIAKAVDAMVKKVSQTIAEIVASGHEVTNASMEISTSTTDLSHRTEEQAASLEQTSAAMEQLSSTVKRNADNAKHASHSARATRDIADSGGKVATAAVQAMAKIEDSSRRISDIIGVIDEIARQTNLLALNAAVESARAGEAGRGFAVVASEVRSLAQRSSQAAKDIKDLITNSVGQVKDGVDLVGKAGTSLTEIVSSIEDVAKVVADIAHANAEQATGIEEINKALVQMDEVTQRNSALVEENAATAKALEHQARAMDAQVSFFKIAANDSSGSHAAHQQEPGAPVAKLPVAKTNAGAAIRPTLIKQPAEPKTSAGADKPEVDNGPVRKVRTVLARAVNAGDDWKEF